MSVKKRDNLSISPWIQRFLPLAQEQGTVLDLAAGGGRHSLFALDRGYRVTSIDRETVDLDAQKAACSPAERSRLEIIEADLEDGSPWPLSGRRFDAVIIVNYLHRPLFPDLLDALAPDGLLLYETFAVGQATFGKPSNPDFLLEPGELLTTVQDRLQVVAYEHGLIDDGKGPAVKQRIAAVGRQEPAEVTMTA